MEKRVAAALAGIEKLFGSQSSSLQAALGTGQPGNWGGNHSAEAQHYTGWTYAAIHQLAKQAMQADIECYRDLAVFDPDIVPFMRQRHKGTIRKVKARKIRKGYGDDLLEAELLPPSHKLCERMLRPNEFQTGGLFNYERVMQLCLTGCVFVWNIPNRNGLTAERYVLPSGAMQAVEPQRGLPNGGWKIDPSAGLCADEDGYQPTTFRRHYVSNAVIRAEEVRLCGFPHPTRKDDFQSPLAAGAAWIDTADELTKARLWQLINGGMPGLWLTEPEDSKATLEEAQATVAAIRAALAGSTNNRKVMYGQGGLDAKVLNPNAIDMDYSGGHTQMRDAVLALMQTPAVAVGADTPKTYGAAAASILFYKWAVVDSTLCFLSDDDTAFFAPQFGGSFGRKGLSVWLSAKNFEDPEIELKGLQTDMAAGNAVTVNEYRSRRGYDPLDDERGDAFVGAATLPPTDPALDPFAPKDEAKPADEQDEDDRGPAPLGLKRPRFSLPGANGNGKSHGNGHLNGHDHFAETSKKVREYLQPGAPLPETEDDALALIKKQWANY